MGDEHREKWHQPQRVRGLESVEVVSARGSGVVSMAIARDGSLWTWGKSKRGQLGLGTKIMYAQTPKRVEALVGQQVVQVNRLSLAGSVRLGSCSCAHS